MPANKKSPAGETVWVACRAIRECDGQQSKVLHVRKLESGSTAYTYRCLKCKRQFVITI